MHPVCGHLDQVLAPRGGRRQTPQDLLLQGGARRSCCVRSRLRTRNRVPGFRAGQVSAPGPGAVGRGRPGGTARGAWRTASRFDAQQGWRSGLCLDHGPHPRRGPESEREFLSPAGAVSPLGISPPAPTMWPKRSKPVWRASGSAAAWTALRSRKARRSAWAMDAGYTLSAGRGAAGGRPGHRQDQDPRWALSGMPRPQGGWAGQDWQHDDLHTLTGSSTRWTRCPLRSGMSPAAPDPLRVLHGRGPWPARDRVPAGPDHRRAATGAALRDRVLAVAERTRQLPLDHRIPAWPAAGPG